MYIAIQKSRRVLSVLLSICLIFTGFPATLARAQNAVVGSGGRITLEAIDPATGKPFLGQEFHSLKPGMKVHFNVKAYDAADNDVGCKDPVFTVNQGVNEPKIKGFIGNDMIMGEGAGFADVFVRCAEVPDARAQTRVVNNTLIALPPTTPTPITPTPITPTPTAAATSNAGMTALGVGAAVVGVGLLVALVAGAAEKTCPSGYHQCRPTDKCCPDGRTIYCPNSNTCTNLTGNGGECGVGQPKRAC